MTHREILHLSRVASAYEKRAFITGFARTARGAARAAGGAAGAGFNRARGAAGTGFNRARGAAGAGFNRAKNYVQEVPGRFKARMQDPYKKEIPDHFVDPGGVVTGRKVMPTSWTGQQMEKIKDMPRNAMSELTNAKELISHPKRWGTALVDSYTSAPIARTATVGALGLTGAGISDVGAELAKRGPASAAYWVYNAGSGAAKALRSKF